MTSSISFWLSRDEAFVTVNDWRKDARLECCQLKISNGQFGDSAFSVQGSPEEIRAIGERIIAAVDALGEVKVEEADAVCV